MGSRGLGRGFDLDSFRFLSLLLSGRIRQLEEAVREPQGYSLRWLCDHSRLVDDDFQILSCVSGNW